MDRSEAVVIGGGAAGLAAAAMLERHGVQALVLERAGAVGEAWRRRYEGLCLNSLGWLSSLPGLRGDWGPRHYPTCEEWIAYLERYARHHRLSIEFGAEAQRVDGRDGGWATSLAQGGAVAARLVVVATGHDRSPFVPPWPGLGRFRGEVLHAAEYRGPRPFRARDVLVAGANTSGTELASQLARGGARRVLLSMRTPPNLTTRYWHGIPLHAFGPLLDRLPLPVADALGRLGQRLVFGDLAAYGLPPAPRGIRSNIAERGMGPAVDDGFFVDALARGRIEVVPAVESFGERSVGLAGGTQVPADAVIAATGYRCGLEPLVGHLGVLDRDGRPLATGPLTVAGAPGLHFIGYMAGASGPLHAMGRDARRIARVAAARRR